MDALLRRAAGVVERRPVVALTVVAVLTVVLGLFAGQQRTNTELTAFAPESELGAAFERVQQEFSTSGASVQVLVDAGTGGDVLGPEGFAAAARVAEVASSTPEVAAALAEPSPQAPPVIGFDAPVRAALDQQGIDVAALDADGLDQAVRDVLASPDLAPQATALLSRDLAASDASARAGLVIVRLAAELDAATQADAERALRDALTTADVGDVEVSPFSETILQDALLNDQGGELPILLGLSFLLIIGILFFTYRRVSDVLLGLGGLVATIVWTYGIGVLLGPDHLGVVGPFSQIATIVPVLLIGLAIDYAIHLTSRYREEQSRGLAPSVAANRAVTSVGGALVLATVTTLVGFMTNVASPLPPIRDFGIFVAGGVLSAFVVMLVLVPSVRSLLDRRRVDATATDAITSPTSEASGPARMMGRLAVLAERHAVRTLVVAGIVTAAAAAAGTQISTTFSQDDFIPEDSAIGTLLDDVQTLFGGDVDERTFVLLEGDLATPGATNAMLAAQAAMADTGGVRMVGGAPSVISPATVLTTLAASAELGPQLLEVGVAPDGIDADADLESAYALARPAAPELLGTVLAEGAVSGVLSISTTAGQDGATDLADELRADVAVLGDAGVATTVVSESLVLDETLAELTASQTRSIAITLGVSLLVLVAFFAVRERRPVLGVVTMVPSVLVVAWVLGSMWVLGLSFNVLTAMVASLAIGIGVPFGIHISHRFTEDLDRLGSIDAALRETVTHTGGALLGSAATTAAGFGVLAFASLVPIQQFGLITALTIAYSLVASVVIEPACLKLWAEWRIGGEPERLTTPERVHVEV